VLFRNLVRRGLHESQAADACSCEQAKPIYRATEIATSHGHLVFFTPHYHPELQPIELIWAQIKGKIADDPASGMVELRLKIEEGFVSLTSNTWINAYMHAPKYEKQYLALEDQCGLMPDDSESDSEEDDDSEDGE
jgi:hypothetical protein